MANRLARESSPYLLLHRDNPVDWYPWGEEAFARARAEDKPIFLSVGYSTCYWCHVMERESFSDPEIARQMNEGFVCVKVDREERPDVDEVYMAATQLISRAGGWPNSVFLTPDLKPLDSARTVLFLQSRGAWMQVMTPGGKAVWARVPKPAPVPKPSKRPSSKASSVAVPKVWCRAY